MKTTSSLSAVTQEFPHNSDTHLEITRQTTRSSMVSIFQKTGKVNKNNTGAPISLKSVCTIETHCQSALGALCHWKCPCGEPSAPCHSCHVGEKASITITMKKCLFLLPVLFHNKICGGGNVTFLNFHLLIQAIFSVIHCWSHFVKVAVFTFGNYQVLFDQILQFQFSQSYKIQHPAHLG